ncbi:hypothetical protein AQUSIP_01210 [Aquicella siphonis]|uniref:Uncharacterized protein n=1 Tax=Aquicella siphonis TaxID=254247 RepID=A0A5E4PEK0_9COXI|nr:hypothetical protein [Aquicella siphonis]VVC74847.1 hypothetical protein AQUSIP_01210 [Aquicella siphonis]
MNLKLVNTQNNSDHSTHDTDLINKLKQLTPIAYDHVRNIFAKEMGIRPATLDSIVKQEKAVRQEGEKSPFPEVMPWHEPVNPENLLSDISNTIKRFICMRVFEIKSS